MVYIVCTAFVSDTGHNAGLSPTVEKERHYGTAREL